MRHFSFTVTVTNAQGYLVDTLRGESLVDGDRSHDQICESIISDLPAHLRQRGYRYGVHLTQL